MDARAKPDGARGQAALLNGDISVELSPEMVGTFEPDVSALPQGSMVFLTHLKGKDPAVQVGAAKRLISMGYKPVVHMGARNFGTDGEFASLVQAHSKNGVTHALFVGGNPMMHTGPLHQALDLLRHRVVRDSAFSSIFFGGYPEGHPDIDRAVMEDALRRKLEVCAALGRSPQVLSQFAFDSKQVVTWANLVASAHPGVPIRLGLAGVTSLPKLIKFAVICGIGPSISVLKKNSRGLMNMMGDRDPGSLISEIEMSYNGKSALSLHFFPFGGWRKTLDWIEEERRR